MSNAARDTEEEKITANAVTAGEDPAPAINIVDGGPEDDVLILPCQAHKGHY